jgi:D-3-phosphoglycerate dehydrogenase
MKIVIADGLPASAIDILQQPNWNIDNRQARPAAELTADLNDADALVVRSATKVTREMIAGAPKLRVIARAGTGVDNVGVASDLELRRRRRQRGSRGGDRARHCRHECARRE